MKKIVSIFTTALLAVMFTACQSPNAPTNPGDDQQSKSADFTLKVTQIEKFQAQATISPKDLEATYWFDVERASKLPANQLHLDSLAKRADDKIKSLIFAEEILTDKDVPYSKYLHTGNINGEDGLLEKLFSNTEYILYAFKMDTTGTASGELATLKFTTDTQKVVGYETIAMKATYYDYINNKGCYSLTADGNDGYYRLSIMPHVSSLTDSISLDNFDQKEDFELSINGTLCTIADLHFRAQLQGDTLLLQGAFVATDGIQYTATITAEKVLDL